VGSTRCTAISFSARCRTARRYKTAPLLVIAAGENHEGTVDALLVAGADVDELTS
jgi:hypothetical protein